MIRRLSNNLALLGILLGVLGSPIAHELIHVVDKSEHAAKSKALGHQHGTDASASFSIGLVLSHIGDLNCTICNPVSSKLGKEQRSSSSRSLSGVLELPQHTCHCVRQVFSFEVRGPPMSA